ncbi:hypothetical protein Tco_0624714 [Tanacetum coccineum]|uniref:Uncharacterized protein n=1 Tax=Tanacetum coccineum TaxID=301880 RepID=A0ABQ4WEQ3_9ASTR
MVQKGHRRKELKENFNTASFMVNTARTCNAVKKQQVTIWDKEVTILILLGSWVTTAWDAWDERSTAAFKILVLLDATVKEYTD